MCIVYDLTSSDSGKAALKTRRCRDLIPKTSNTTNTSDSTSVNLAKRKIEVDEYTLPSKTCVRRLEKEVHLPLALKSIEDAVSI